MASCRPMFPTVTPPEKNIHGSQERTYKKSGDVYLKDKKKIILNIILVLHSKPMLLLFN